jgi:hypothetical protein
MKFIFIYRIGEKDKMFLKGKDFVFLFFFLLFTIASSVSCASGAEDEDRGAGCPSFCSVCKQIIDSFKETFCHQQRVAPVGSISVDRSQERVIPAIPIPIGQPQLPVDQTEKRITPTVSIPITQEWEEYFRQKRQAETLFDEDEEWEDIDEETEMSPPGEEDRYEDWGGEIYALPLGPSFRVSDLSARGWKFGESSVQPTQGNQKLPMDISSNTEECVSEQLAVLIFRLEKHIQTLCEIRVLNERNEAIQELLKNLKFANKTIGTLLRTSPVDEPLMKNLGDKIKFIGVEIRNLKLSGILQKKDIIVAVKRVKESQDQLLINKGSVAVAKKLNDPQDHLINLEDLWKMDSLILRSYEDFSKFLSSASSVKNQPFSPMICIERSSDDETEN